MMAHANTSDTEQADENPAKTILMKLPCDPIEAAEAADLHYVSDAMPGIRRRRAGRGFSYRAPDGSRLRDPRTLERIRRLVIPPAWTDVWICPSPDGHIQATGRDAKGRKQYRYHPRWRAVRDSTKYDRMIAFGQALPTIRERVAQDMERCGLPREKVLATVVELLQTTFIRIGNHEYTRQNQSFGLTTLRDRHVRVSGSEVQFEFIGKSGKRQRISLRDRRLARIVKRCREIRGYELFQYLDEDGQRHLISSHDVNAYIREISGENFTAKDFRTWAGTVVAADELRRATDFETKQQAEQQVVDAIKIVAAQLGNTPAICRRCYVHPAVIDAYLEHRYPETDPELGDQDDHLRPEERFVLAILRETSAESQAA